MWFLLQTSDRDGDITSYPASIELEFDGYKVERRKYLIPKHHMQTNEAEYTSKKKTIKGEVWHRTDKTYKWNALPKDHEKWKDVTVVEVDEFRRRYDYVEEAEDWFVEINTLEEYLAFDKDYGSDIYRREEGTPYEVIIMRIY